MTYVEQHHSDPMRFRVWVPIADEMFSSFDILAMDVMRLPRLTKWADLKPHQRTTYRKVIDGIQSMHLFQVMWEVEAISFAQEHDPNFDFDLSNWLAEADECITITFKDRDAAMLFKLTYCGT